MIATRLKSTFNQPVFWFGLFMLFFAVNRYLIQDDQTIYRGDGRGYYAYLPALTFNDPSFQKVIQAESDYFGQDKVVEYLLIDEEGRAYNKYFPGTALMQSPFYFLAVALNSLSNKPIDGYSGWFEFMYILGMLFYAIGALYLYVKSLNILFPENRRAVQLLLPALYLATPLFFYSVNTTGYSHVYSLFLFMALTYLLLKHQSRGVKRIYWKTGLLLGLVFLVRPTNVLIVFAFPIMLGSRDQLSLFLTNAFSHKMKGFLSGLLGFVLILSVLFAVWKWETDSWILWSYSGEGFNFFHPKLWDTLFSYRIGLFIHAPILLFIILGLMYMYRRQSYLFVWYGIYFLINTWVIASWWCWDYESGFGHRAFVEHLPILGLPLIYWFANAKSWKWIALSLVVMYGIIRIEGYNSGFMVNQRFTQDNYWSSLAVWKHQNHNRWQFTKSCKPFGKLENETTLFEARNLFRPASTYFASGIARVVNAKSNANLYCVAKMEKRYYKGNIEQLLLVIDATENGKTVYYNATPLFADKEEGKEGWGELTLEARIPKGAYEIDQVKMYIWNQGEVEIGFRNVKLSLQEY